MEKPWTVITTAGDKKFKTSAIALKYAKQFSWAQVVESAGAYRFVRFIVESGRAKTI